MHKSIIFKVLGDPEVSVKAAAVKCNTLFKVGSRVMAVSDVAEEVEIEKPEGEVIEKPEGELAEKPKGEVIEKPQEKKIIEETFGLCNTPIQNGYIRIVASVGYEEQ